MVSRFSSSLSASVAVSLVAVVSAISMAACAAPTDEQEDDVASAEGELRGLSAAEILGDLAYGQTSPPVAYTKKPTYRAYRFEAQAGDEVDIWVRSTDGNPRAWLLTSSFANVVSNEDADATTKDAHITRVIEKAGTYYIAFREGAGKSANLTVSLAKLEDAPAPGGCAAKFSREKRSGCYYAGQPGCELREVVVCEDGFKGPREQYFTSWIAMVARCEGHCVPSTKRLDLVARGTIPVNSSSFQHGSCPYPVGFGNSTSLEVRVMGPATSPFVVWSGSTSAQSVGPDGRFAFGNLEGRVSGAAGPDGKFVLADPPSVTITHFHYYSNGGSGGTCGASMDLASPTMIPLVRR